MDKMTFKRGDTLSFQGTAWDAAPNPAAGETGRARNISTLTIIFAARHRVNGHRFTARGQALTGRGQFSVTLPPPHQR